MHRGKKLQTQTMCLLLVFLCFSAWGADDGTNTTIPKKIQSTDSLTRTQLKALANQAKGTSPEVTEGLAALTKKYLGLTDTQRAKMGPELMKKILTLKAEISGSTATESLGNRVPNATDQDKNKLGKIEASTTGEGDPTLVGGTPVAPREDIPEESLPTGNRGLVANTQNAGITPPGSRGTGDGQGPLGLQPGDPLIAQIQDFISQNLASINRQTEIGDSERTDIATRVDSALEAQAEAEGRGTLTHQGGGRGPVDAVAAAPAFDAEEEGRENLSRAAQQLALEGLAENDIEKMARAASMMIYEMNDNSVNLDFSGADFSENDVDLLSRVLGDRSSPSVLVVGSPTPRDDGLRIRTLEARGVRVGERLPPAYAGKGNTEEIRSLERRPRGIASLYKEDNKKIPGVEKKKKKPLGLPAFATKAMKKSKSRRAASKSLFNTLMATLRLQGAMGSKGKAKSAGPGAAGDGALAQVPGEGTRGLASLRPQSRSEALKGRTSLFPFAAPQWAGAVMARPGVWGLTLLGLFLGWLLARRRAKNR